MAVRLVHDFHHQILMLAHGQRKQDRDIKICVSESHATETNRTF